MKRILLVILVLAAIAGAAYYFLTREKEGGNNFIKISGNIEATEADVGFKVSGRIINRYYEEGDWVEKGKVLARLDSEDLRNRLELARATFLSAQARLTKLSAGSRPEEIREAEAAVNQAKFDRDNKQIQYERMKLLYEKRVIPKESYDNSETALKVAKAALERVNQSYLLVKEGPRKEDIDDARAQVEQAKASLKLAETQLSYAVIYSPFSGVVLVKSGEVGEVVNPGTPVLTLADIENVWLKAYIAETDLGKIKWGQEVIVTTDLRPQKDYKGQNIFHLLPGRIYSQEHSDRKREGDPGLPHQSGYFQSESGIEARDASRWKDSPRVFLLTQSLKCYLFRHPT